MGITFRGETPGHQIRDFWPDDTDTEIHIAGDECLEDILEDIAKKWPGTPMSDITISSQKIQTRCLDYDLHDPSDWTDFIIIRRASAAK